MAMNHPIEQPIQEACGFVYVATGKEYVVEARRSAIGLRELHPDNPICLVTDATPPGEPFWTDLVILTDPAFGYVDKIEMRQSPYTKSIFLDADTHIIGRLDEVFHMLDRYDMCGVQLMEGHDYAIQGIPISFPEINSGFLAFRKSSRMAEFFSLWLSLYQEYHRENEAGQYHYANEGDQKSLRAAVWNSDIRFLGLGPEFNFIPFKIEFACLAVRMIHSHHVRGVSVLADRLNAIHARRAYVPALDVVLSEPFATSELAKLVVRSTLMLIRHVFRSLLPMHFKEILRKNALVHRLMVHTKFTAAKPND